VVVPATLGLELAPLSLSLSFSSSSSSSSSLDLIASIRASIQSMTLPIVMPWPCTPDKDDGPDESL
jgi:hypothetical protein